MSWNEPSSPSGENFCTHCSPAVKIEALIIVKVSFAIYATLEPFGVIRKNWNDTEKISMAPAQG